MAHEHTHHHHDHGHARHGDNHGHHGDSAADWDLAYSEVAQRWSGSVNPSLVAEATDLPPSRAVDLGCGEGGDAVWLAQRGWQVTAIDISKVAIERASAAAAEVGVEIDFVCADIGTDGIQGAPFDLVSAHYPAFPLGDDRRVVDITIDAVAPGGTLLVVHHDMSEHGPHPDFDPSHYMLPADVAAALGDGWIVDIDETRTYEHPEGYGGPDVPDVVFKARRTSH